MGVAQERGREGRKRIEHLPRFDEEGSMMTLVECKCGRTTQRSNLQMQGKELWKGVERRQRERRETREIEKKKKKKKVEARGLWNRRVTG